MFSSKKTLFAILLTLCVGDLAAQATVTGQGVNRRAISTAVPFLAITPDARSAGMGDVGVAVSADANAIHWNPAKLAFVETKMSVALSFSPWLKNLVPDMSLSYLSGFKRINKRGVVGASLRYFDLGNLQLTNNQGQSLGDYNPREVALDVSYAMQLSKSFSMAITGRYIYSNLVGNVSNSQVNINGSPGQSISADISAFYKKEIVLASLKTELALGANISNIGQKITYNSVSDADFIPTNMRLGAAYGIELDDFNKVTFAVDMNKLLVPSPPLRNPQTNQIIGGQDPNRSLLSGIFGSFADAPNGFSEEIQEITYATGVEYWYNNLFALRGGYFHESFDKGNRKYFTAGLGLRYNAFGIDFAYMVPQEQNHPLSDTMRFTLLFDFDKKKAKEEN